MEGGGSGSSSPGSRGRGVEGLADGTAAREFFASAMPRYSRTPRRRARALRQAAEPAAELQLVEGDPPRLAKGGVVLLGDAITVGPTSSGRQLRPRGRRRARPLPPSARDEPAAAAAATDARPTRARARAHLARLRRQGEPGTAAFCCRPSTFSSTSESPPLQPADGARRGRAPQLGSSRAARASAVLAVLVGTAAALLARASRGRAAGLGRWAKAGGQAPWAAGAEPDQDRLQRACLTFSPLDAVMRRFLCLLMASARVAAPAASS